MPFLTNISFVGDVEIGGQKESTCIAEICDFDSNCGTASLAQWLARQTSNLKAASSSLARGATFLLWFTVFTSFPTHYIRYVCSFQSHEENAWITDTNLMHCRLFLLLQGPGRNCLQ